MRHRFFSWTLGLLCVSWLAGCCCLGNGDNRGRTTKVVRKGAQTSAPVKEGDTIIEATPTELLPTPKKATPLNGPGAPKRMPEAPVKAPVPPPIVEPLPLIPLLDMPPANPVAPPLALPAPPAPPRSDSNVPTSPLPPREERLEFPPTKVTPSTKPEPGPGLEITPLPPALMREMSNKDETVMSVHVKHGSVDELQTLTGQVLRWQKTWRLRYAPVDQDDPFGGSVTLDGGAELSKLRDDQLVRVRGIIVPADERTGVTRFRVNTIEILD